MRRGLAGLATATLTVGLLAGCGQSEEEECVENYLRTQTQLTGQTPSESEADQACDGDGYRGGGSDDGK